jgi:uncharacterized integral membrane protein
METETLLKFIPPTISLIVTSLFGLLVGILIEKFKNRYRTIEYSIRSQKIKPPLSQSLGGSLSIKLNNREINTLKVATVEIENKNNIDFENIVVRFSIGPNSWFQSNEAYISKNYSPLFWTLPYSNNYDQIVNEYNACEVDPQNGDKIISNELQQRINFVLANRDYLIPVFNRKDKAVFNFLIEDPADGNEGYIFPSIVHKSINFIKKSDSKKQEQKDLWISVIIGIIFVALIITVIVLNNKEQSSVIIWSAVVGISYSIVGYLLLNAFRRIKAFFR